LARLHRLYHLYQWSPKWQLEPFVPEKPEVPELPEVPLEPPEVPVVPEEPEEPEELEEAEVPAKPEDPDEPEVPDPVDIPEEPDEPTEPEEPEVPLPLEVPCVTYLTCFDWGFKTKARSSEDPVGIERKNKSSFMTLSCPEFCFFWVVYLLFSAM
jgi:hypothetical protein